MEELEEIDRQLALDDLDVAPDGVEGVVGEAQDVAAIGDAADALPGQQHLAVFGDLVLALLGAEQAVGIDVLQPDEDPLHPGPRAFLDKIRDAVAEGIDLDEEIELEPFLLAKRDEAIHDRLPILVAGEIVVGDEEAVDALGDIRPDDRLDILGRAPARLPPLNVDDRAEGALIRAAAPGIEAGNGAGSAPDAHGGQHRHRHALERRQVVHEIVERLQLPLDRIAQHLLQPALLRLAGEEEDAHLLRAAHIRIALRQHGDGAGDMEAADPDHDPALPERAGDVEGTRELVGLDADQHHDADIRTLQQGSDLARLDTGIGL